MGIIISENQFKSSVCVCVCRFVGQVFSVQTDMQTSVKQLHPVTVHSWFRNTSVNFILDSALARNTSSLPKETLTQ